MWWVQHRDKLPHLPFTHPVNDENKKGSFTEDVSVSTNDYNATFVKWDDLAHHRTSSILIETSARYLICLYGSQIPASQNNSEGNRRWVGIWNSWSFILQHMELCELYQFVDDDVFWRKNCVLFSTSAQPFEMQMTMAYWKIVVLWEYQASDELKLCFGPRGKLPHNVLKNKTNKLKNKKNINTVSLNLTKRHIFSYLSTFFGIFTL